MMSPVVAARLRSAALVAGFRMRRLDQNGAELDLHVVVGGRHGIEEALLAPPNPRYVKVVLVRLGHLVHLSHFEGRIRLAVALDVQRLLLGYLSSHGPTSSSIRVKVFSVVAMTTSGLIAIIIAGHVLPQLLIPLERNAEGALVVGHLTCDV